MSKTIKITDESYEAMKEFISEENDSISKLASELIMRSIEKMSESSEENSGDSNLENSKLIPDKIVTELLKRLDNLQEDQTEILKKFSKNNSKLFERNGMEKFEQNTTYEEKRVAPPLRRRYKGGKEIRVTNKFPWNCIWEIHGEDGRAVCILRYAVIFAKCDLPEQKIAILNEFILPEWYHFEANSLEEMIQECEKRLYKKYCTPGALLPEWITRQPGTFDSPELREKRKKILEENENKGGMCYDWERVD